MLAPKRNKFLRILKSLELCLRLDRKLLSLNDQFERLEQKVSNETQESKTLSDGIASRIDQVENSFVEKIQNLAETLDDLRARHPLPRIVNMPNAALRPHALKLISLLKPYDVLEANMVRVGRDFDGGYVMLDKGIASTCAYSLGVSDDVSWDLEMAERGCDVFQYDHTIDCLPRDHVNFHWSKLEIGPKSAHNPELRTIAEIVDDNGHSARNDLILKMDIEGSEWSTLEEESPETLSKFSQLVIEFHWLMHIYDPNHLRRFVNVFSKLNETHRIVHVHANNYGSIALIAGVLIPDSLEVTFVRITDHEFVESGKTFPTHLDMPCDPNKGDIFLGALGRLSI